MALGVKVRRVPGFLSVGTGRYSPVNDPTGKDGLYLPARFKADGTVPGIVQVHGAGGKAGDSIDITGPGSFLFGAAIMAEFPMVETDLGGTYNWGNPLCQTCIEDARLYLISKGAKPGPVIISGGSMGGLGSLLYAANNPSKVLGCLEVFPIVDIEQARTLYGASVETAWGIGSGGTFPAGSNPILRTADFAGIPIQIYNALNDTAAPASYSNSFAASCGPKAKVLTVGANGHSALTVADINVNDMLAFIRSL